MDAPIKPIDQSLRSIFKSFNPYMLLLWRLGLGSWLNAWPEVGGRIMVITHTGRKSGLRRQTPVNYAIVDGEIYCVAGFGQISDWYRNLLAQPQVEVWLPEGWWMGRADDISDHPERLHLVRQVLVASGFAARAAGVDPVEMADEELAKVTADYRLVRIRRSEARTGPGGPGDLAWVWPLATLLLLPLALRRRRKPRA